MPARTSARRTRTKAFKRCSKNRKPGCSRKKLTCSYDERRTPRCQPRKATRRRTRKTTARSAKRRSSTGKRMRRMTSRSRRRASSRKKARAKTGTLLDEDDIKRKEYVESCRTSATGCPKDCGFDKKTGRCYPFTLQDEAEQNKAIFEKFLQRVKQITWSSGGPKPNAKVSFPVNEKTLIGDYAGALLASPKTGTLHLCYGPAQGSSDMILSSLIHGGDDLVAWYNAYGAKEQEAREQELQRRGQSSGDIEYYISVYALTRGVTLTYREVQAMKDLQYWDKLTTPPSLPPFLHKSGALPKSTASSMGANAMNAIMATSAQNRGPMTRAANQTTTVDDLMKKVMEVAQDESFWLSMTPERLEAIKTTIRGLIRMTAGLSRNPNFQLDSSFYEKIERLYVAERNRMGNNEPDDKLKAAYVLLKTLTALKIGEPKDRDPWMNAMSPKFPEASDSASRRDRFRSERQSYRGAPSSSGSESD